jgi:hypothetical protein
MAYKDGLAEPYPSTVEFSQEQLLSIKPEEVAGWFKLLSYGTSTPNPDDKPTECRASNLAFCKKALSFFMPNRQHWVVGADVGNPTKSEPVNQVINDVRKAEVRKQGRPSNAKRDMKKAEFRKTLRILEDSRGLPGVNHFDCASKMTAMMKLQFHIIGRTDDITNVETADLKSHEKFGDFALQMKVHWSKNVLDERDCPDQLLIGAMDDDFCVLIALACYLESRLSSTVGNRFLFCDGEDDLAPDRLNARYYRVLRACWRNPDFQQLLRLTRGSIGTHSLRKFPSTYCAEQGAAQREVEICGRWKGAGGGRIVNRYISVDQLPTDAKLAGMLCVGGPVKYKVKDDAGNITEEFLTTTVVPAIHSFFSQEESNHIAAVLAPVLLYACHVPELSHLILPAVRQRVVEGYRAIAAPDKPADYNPVEKIPLHIYRIENQVNIEEMVPMAGDRAGADGPRLFDAASHQANRENMQSLMLQVHQIRISQQQHQQQTTGNFTALRQYCSTQFGIINNKMGRYFQLPTRPLQMHRPHRFGGIGAPAGMYRRAQPMPQQGRQQQQQQQGQQGQQGQQVPTNVGNTNNGDTANDAPQEQHPPQGAPLRPMDFLDPYAKLGKPKSLLELWHEYIHGAQGGTMKPAKDFTPAERGRCRHKYCRRKAFWDVMIKLINTEYDELTAIQKIEQCYGSNLPVTKMLDKLLVKARREGYHANLGVRAPNSLRGARVLNPLTANGIRLVDV